MNGLKKCESCERIIEPEQMLIGDEGTSYADKPICEDCYCDDEPHATLVFSEAPKEPLGIGTFRNMVLSERNELWRVNYRNIGGWRGYYYAEPPDNWERLHTDNILAISEDADNLKEFDRKIIEALDRAEIPWVKVFCRSSNIFSTGYDLYVKKGQAERVENARAELAKYLRSPATYHITAITGQNPSDCSPEDILASVFFSALMGKGEAQ